MLTWTGPVGQPAARIACCSCRSEDTAGVSSAVTVLAEGSRMLLAEVQALCSRVPEVGGHWELLSLLVGLSLCPPLRVCSVPEPADPTFRNWHIRARA